MREDIPISPVEPLKLESKHFVNSIKKGEKLDPLCGTQEALQVLKIITKLFDLIEMKKEI